MVKDVIAVIHDCIKKSHIIFITNFIERGLVWWKETLFDGPGFSFHSFHLDTTDFSRNNPSEPISPHHAGDA